MHGDRSGPFHHHKIFEHHGGTIGETSQPGRTTFTILLPQSSPMETSLLPHRV
jgi:nitrogen-specific signal transduction histidine kinase